MKTIKIFTLLAIVIHIGCGGKKEEDSNTTGDANTNSMSSPAESGEAQGQMEEMVDEWIIEGNDTELTNTWAEDAYGGDSEEGSGFYWVSEHGDTIYKKTEIPPEFVGGQEALVEYFEENIKYPVDAEKGKVYVAFVVTDEGEITDARVVKGVSESMDEEALRAVQDMPLWDPAMYEGRAVYAVHGIPVPFNP